MFFQRIKLVQLVIDVFGFLLSVHYSPLINFCLDVFHLQLRFIRFLVWVVLYHNPFSISPSELIEQTLKVLFSQLKTTTDLR